MAAVLVLLALAALVGVAIETLVVGRRDRRRVEALRTAWMDAESALQPALAGQMQAAAFDELPYIPLGQFFQQTAYRRELTGMLKGPTMFWNIQRQG